MFIVVQNNIVQAAVIQQIELASPMIRIYLAGRDPLEIVYATKADSVSAFKRIAGALRAEETDVSGSL